MCGLAFSGKTTLARAIVDFTAAISISLDEINRERGVGFGGEGLPVAEWERTHRIALDRAGQLMLERVTILVDDTSNLRFLRERFRSLASTHGYRLVLVYVETPLDEVRRRMRENARHESRPSIRPDVFDEHLRTFEPPDEDEDAVVFAAGEPVDDWLKRTLATRAASA
jgi:predicted kinase